MVPLGYADGIDRKASNVAPLVINGQSTKIMGRVCMDQFVVPLPGDSAAGDRAYLFGDAQEGLPTADDWAEAMGTIGYEVVTSPWGTRAAALSWRKANRRKVWSLRLPKLMICATSARCLVLCCGRRSGDAGRSAGRGQNNADARNRQRNGRHRARCIANVRHRSSASSPNIGTRLGSR